MGRFRLKAKHSRRAGVLLSENHAKVLQKRNYPPGQHGPNQTRRRLTGYGTQLLEKQKARWMYGLRESQFKKYFQKSVRKEGETATNLFQLVERRLDNVVYRMGFAKTRAHARQIVSHGHILVNGKRVNIPSYQVQINDTITLREKSAKSAMFADLGKRMEKMEVLDWIAVDHKNLTGKMIALPNKDTTAHPYDLKVIIEYYSR
jgi:small subunit ribosomal protein S4